MAALLVDIGGLVATASSVTLGTTLFLGTLPATPDACMAIKEYPGSPPDFVFGDNNISVEYPRVQVLARGAQDDYATARSQAELAYKALGAAVAQSISGTRYLAFRPLTAPFDLGRDANNRPIIGFNLLIEKGRSA
jgi:hypothetical protein